MLFAELLLALLLGVGAGIVTGLLPGIHVNLITVLVTTNVLLFAPLFSTLSLAVFIISLAITHSFLDSLPSIYLGAPGESHALSALPGHKLLLEGKGHIAILCTLIGSLGTVILCAALSPLFLLLLKRISTLIQPFVAYILIFIVIVMIAREKRRWLNSLYHFLAAASLGIVTLSLPNLAQPLFPLLSGLFGVSLLLLSLKDSSTIPMQGEGSTVSIPLTETATTISLASFVGFIAAFLPGFGNSQAAILASSLQKDPSPQSFLVLTGGINTANMLISICTAFALSKARNGAIVGVLELVESITPQYFLFFLLVSLLSASLAVIIAISLSRIFAKLIVKVNYQILIAVIILFITALTLYFDGGIGLLILLSATSIGMSAGLQGVAKNHLMGCLIVPVIGFLLL